jgi:hypothetical protein
MGVQRNRRLCVFAALREKTFCSVLEEFSRKDAKAQRNAKECKGDPEFFFATLRLCGRKSF